MNKKLLIFGIISLILVASLIFIIALSEGYYFPDIGENDDSIGIKAWTDPEHITAADHSYAKIEIFEPGGDNHAEDYSVRLVKNGVIVGDNLAHHESLPIPLTYVYYGGNSSLWGETWTVEDIKDVDFGVVYSVEGKVGVLGFPSYYLKASDFDFANIPTGSTIDGIRVGVHCEQQLVGDGVVLVDDIVIKVYYTPPEGIPQTIVNDASFGTVYWVNPSYAKYSDNSYTTATDDSGTTPSTVYLKATNFGFNIPTDATILGIKVVVEKSCDNQDASRHAQDSRVRLVNAFGQIRTTDRSSSAWWPVSDTNVSHGGATDLWGDSWTPANINDPDFGFVISAYLVNNGGEVIAKIDYVRIIIYYSTDTCDCPGLNQNWEINMADHCLIASTCNLGTGKLSFTGSGYANCDASITTTNMGDPGASGILYINSNCVITIDG